MPRWPKRKPRQDVDEYGRAEIWYAAADGEEELVRRLLQKGADPNSPDDVAFTTLHVAAQNGHVHVVRTLLNSGANPNAVDSHGNGPLWTALLSSPKEKKDDLISVLLASGADPDCANEHGRSPREMAMTIGQEI